MKQQIEEKQRRIQSQTEMKARHGMKVKVAESDMAKHSNSNNTNIVHNDYSPAVTSSRYSNSNTACTRNLFTPSEDNCLSQHLVSYSNQREERKVTTSDLNMLKTEPSSSIKAPPTPTLASAESQKDCNIVQEEGSKEDVRTNESIVSLKSPAKIPAPVKAKKIMLENQENGTHQSIHQLEDMIDVLIKEQQNLKSKLNTQEKVISEFKTDQDSIQTMGSDTHLTPNSC